MKRALAIAALTISVPVLAQDLRLGDLNFFQSEGTVYWNTEFSTVSGEVETQSDANTFQQFETERNVWSNTVLYGISDRLNVGLSVDYALTNEFDSVQLTELGNPNFSGRDYENKGLSDFTINANYRLVSENYYLDLISGLTLGLGESERGFGSAAAREDGNFNQGHHSLLAGVAVGQKVYDVEWRAIAAFDYHADGEQKIFGTTGSDTFDTDSYLNWILRGEAQYRFLKRYAIAGYLQYNLVGEREISGTVNNVNTDFTYDSHAVWTHGVVGKFNVNDSILLKAGAALIREYQVDVQRDQGFIIADGKTEYDGSTEFMVGAEFLF